MDQEKVFCEGSERKEVLLDHKTIGSKNHQDLHFFKGVCPWFLSKNGDFVNFCFFGKWMKKKGFVKFSERKEAFLGYKNIG